MKPYASRFLCLLIILSALNSAFAQTIQETPAAQASAAQIEAEKEKAAREQESKQALEKKAVAALIEIAESADALRLPVNRASTYGAVGVLLWKYDDKQARLVVNSAAQEIIAAQNAADEEDGDGGSSSGFGNYSPNDWELQEARRFLAVAVAPLDAEFALEIFRRTRSSDLAALMQSPKSVFPNGSDHNRVQNEINTEQTLANEAARQDPKRAVKLAREILEKGVSHSLLDLIERIKEKEPEEASRLADELGRKLRDADLSSGYNERNLAVNFITRFAPKSAPETAGGNNSSSSGTAAADKPKFAADEAGLRALADKLVNFFLRDAQAENYYYQMAQLIPALEKLLPARAEQLRRRESEIKQRQARSNPYERLNRLNENADAETLVSEAQNAPAEVKSQYYASAANKLIGAENPNVERARAVINSIPERRAREYAMQNLNNQLFYKAIGAGRIDEARRIVAQTKNKNLQISFLVQISNQLRQKKDEKLTRQTLDEAAALIPGTNPENREEMNAIVQLVNAYAHVAPEASFALLEPLFGRFAQLLDASILLNRFAGGQPIRADEITSQFFQNSIGQFGFYFNQPEMAKLAAADFDRAIGLANGFQRPEARVFARLMIVQAALSQTENKTGVITNLPIMTRVLHGK